MTTQRATVCPSCGRAQPEDAVSFECAQCGADLAADAVKPSERPRPLLPPLAIGAILAVALFAVVVQVRTCTSIATDPGHDRAARILDGGTVEPPTPVNFIPPPKPGLLAATSTTTPEVWPVAGAGTIRGRIAWQRAVPPPTLPFLSGDRDCGVTIFFPLVPTGELAGVPEAVVVAVPAGVTPPPAPPRVAPLEASLRACLPEPRLLAAAPGTKLKLRSVGLASHALGSDVPLAGLPATVKAGAPLELEIPQTGMAIVSDAAHPWERFTLVALPHALSTTVNSEGLFFLGGVPPGDVTVRIYTEATGVFERRLHLPPGGDAMLFVDLADETPGFGKPADPAPDAGTPPP